MPWCPKCGIEYREGFETCSDCGCELSEEPVPVDPDSVPEAEADAESESKPESEPQFDQEAFLISTENSIEAEMIEGLLNADEIPVLKKYDDGGDYLKIYMGGVTSGVDLYVPSHLLDKAKEILEASQGILGGSEIPEEELEAQALAAKPEDEDPEDEEEPGNEEVYEDDLAEEDLAENEETGDEETEDEGNGDEKPVNEESENEESSNEEFSVEESSVEESLDKEPAAEEPAPVNKETERKDSELQGNSFFQRFIRLLTGK
jgi:hypothetical protein